MSAKMKKILIEASGCHVHLTQTAIETLFGKGAQLKKRRDLSQPGEFLSEQRLKLVTKDGVIDHVAVLGPARNAVQVELSMTDCRKLGIKAPVNLSGDLSGASDVILVGTHGEMKANGSVIVARNHIHMRPEDAEEYGVADGQKVRVLVQSDRKVIFEDVPIRVKSSFMPAMHIDFDEANACGYRVGTEAFILYEDPEVCDPECKPDMSGIVRQVVESVTDVLRKEGWQKPSPKVEACEQVQPVCQPVHEKPGTGALPVYCAPATDMSAIGEAPVYKPKSKPISAYVPDYMKASAAVCPAPVIETKLVTEKAAQELIKSTEEKTICFARGAIITPAAKDIFKNNKRTIKIV